MFSWLSLSLLPIGILSLSAVTLFILFCQDKYFYSVFKLVIVHPLSENFLFLAIYQFSRFLEATNRVYKNFWSEIWIMNLIKCNHKAQNLSIP